VNCPGCQERVFGLDCEKCGRSFPAECPSCRSFFTAVDQYCRNCGRDLFFLNFSNKVRLKFPINLLTEAFEYPPDRLGLKLLQKTGPLREITRLFIREISEPMFHGQLLGTAVRVSERQFPEIRRISSICERILNLQPVNIFVGHSPSRLAAISAFTYGTEDSACIFLSSILVETLTQNELLFVIGHEMGHIKSRHVLYLTIAQMFALGFSTFQGVTGQVLSTVIRQLLSPWQRKAEITADRAGLVCCQNISTAIRTMVKVALGTPNLFSQIDLEEYLSQSDTLRKDFSWSNSTETHPYLIHRVNYLKEFHRSSQYRQIFQTGYDPDCPKILCAGCKSYEYLDDRRRPLLSLKCSSCHAALGIVGIYCPHCHRFARLTDGDVTLASFRCSECRKGYFEDVPPRIQGMPDTHYDVLGVHRSCSDEDIERAYVRKVKPTLKAEVERCGVHPTPQDIKRRVKAHVAYQTLSRRKSREDYNRWLGIVQELYRHFDKLNLDRPPEALSTCEHCEAPVYGPYCAQCGASGSASPTGQTSRGAGA